jgi:hypothetical protein
MQESRSIMQEKTGCHTRKQVSFYKEEGITQKSSWRTKSQVVKKESRSFNRREQKEGVEFQCEFPIYR